MPHKDLNFGHRALRNDYENDVINFSQNNRDKDLIKVYSALCKID